MVRKLSKDHPADEVDQRVIKFFEAYDQSQLDQIEHKSNMLLQLK